MLKRVFSTYIFRTAKAHLLFLIMFGVLETVNAETCHLSSGMPTTNAKRASSHESFCPFIDTWLYEEFPYNAQNSQADQQSPHPVYIERQEKGGPPQERDTAKKASVQVEPQVRVPLPLQRSMALYGVVGFKKNPKLRICRPLYTPSQRSEPCDICEQTISCFLENIEVENMRGAGWSLAHARVKDMHLVSWEFLEGLGMLRCSIDYIVGVKFNEELPYVPAVMVGIESTDYDRRSDAAVPVSENDQAIVWLPERPVASPVDVTASGFKLKCTLSAQGYYDVRSLYEVDGLRPRPVGRAHTAAKNVDFRDTLQLVFNNMVMAHAFTFALCHTE